MDDFLNELTTWKDEHSIFLVLQGRTFGLAKKNRCFHTLLDIQPPFVHQPCNLYCRLSWLEGGSVFTFFLMESPQDSALTHEIQTVFIVDLLFHSKKIYKSFSCDILSMKACEYVKLWEMCLENVCSLIFQWFLCWQALPSKGRSPLLVTDVSNLLLCVRQILPAICNDASELIGCTQRNKVVRDIHAKCHELLVCLIFRGSPLSTLYKVIFVTDFRM